MKNTKTPIISYTFVGERGQPSKEGVKKLVQQNLDHKMDAYLEKIYSRADDVVVKIKVTVEKTHKGSYSGSFFLRYSGEKKPIVYIREHFNKLDDLINHAFDHFKLELSDLELT